MTDVHDVPRPACCEAADVFSPSGEAFAETHEQILLARISLRLELAHKQRMIVGEIRVQTMHCLRYGNGKLFRQRNNLRVRSLHADLGTYDKHRILSFD